MTLERLLTDKEAADALGVSKSTLQAWRCTGRVPLPFIKLGRAVRYRREDIAAFIEQHAAEHTGVAGG
jgi:excisionase family DNA binding protein